LNICKNCSNQFTGKYCNNCGEKVYTEKDRSFFHLFEEFFHFVSHFEGTLFTTLRTIFKYPGKFAADYCAGIRKKYFKPISLFLLIVILYLLFPLFPGLNMPVNGHYGNDLYGKFAHIHTVKIFNQSHLTEEQFVSAYQAKSEKVSKFLLFTILPFTALVSWLFTFRKRKHYFDQFIFSTELNSFFILWMFILFPALYFSARNISAWFGKTIPFNDQGLAIISYLSFTVFAFFAAKRFYNLKTIQAIFFTLVFALFQAAFIHYIYEFLLYIISISLVH
jgi:hypothetical protein